MTTFTKWLTKQDFRYFSPRFDAKVVGTPFEGAYLTQTENKEIVKLSNYYESWTETQFETIIHCDKLTHLEIPGFDFLGMVKWEEGVKFIHSFGNPDFEWKNIIDDITPTRCDVCNTKHFRTKVFILRNKDSKEVVVVGGSCSKQFKTIDLEVLCSMMITQINKICDELMDEEKSGYRPSYYRNLASEIATCEWIISQHGYMSKSKAMEGDTPTSTILEMVIVGKVLIPLDSRESIKVRATELKDSEFAALKEYYNAKQEARWSDFNHNCLQLLEVEQSSKTGMIAWLANTRFILEAEKAAESIQNTSQKPVTGYPGPVGVMMDLGRFTVVHVSSKENHFTHDLDYAFIMVNDQNEKIWAKTSNHSKAAQAWNEAIGRNLDWEIPLSAQGYQVDVRGKIKSIEDTITFVSHIKFTNLAKVD